MRLPCPRRNVLLAAAVAAMAMIPVAVSLLNAQVMVCYAEWCIPTDRGERCYVKIISCPPPEPT